MSHLKDYHKPPIVKAKQTRLISPLDNRLLKLQLLIQSIFIISANFIFSTFRVSNINPYILHALLRMPLSVQLLNGTSSLDPGNSVYSLRLCSNLQNVYYYSTKEKKTDKQLELVELSNSSFYVVIPINETNEELLFIIRRWSSSWIGVEAVSFHHVSASCRG